MNVFSQGPWSQTPLSFKDFQQWWSRHANPWQPGNRGKKISWLLACILGLCLALWASTGIYHVNLGEKAIILRFGRVSAITTEGLHYHWPYPIEQAIIRNVAAVNRIDSEGSKLVLTQDENIVDVNFTVLWVIKDIQHYVFRAKYPNTTVQSAADSVVREILAHTSLENALTTGRATINHKAQTLLQSLVDSYGLGIHILEFQMGRIDPPNHQVIDAYRDLHRAKAEQQRLMNEAETYAIGKMAEARGHSATLIHEAEARYASAVLKAQGDKEKLTALATQAKHMPDLVKERLYLNTMETVLAQASKTLVDPAIPGILPHMNIGTLPVKPSPKKAGQ